jgi:hypothetical protein
MGVGKGGLVVVVLCVALARIDHFELAVLHWNSESGE